MSYGQRAQMSSTQVSSTQVSSPQISGAYDSEFFEILKAGIGLSDPVLNDILQVHSPIALGPIGSPVGALAGAILASTGKLTTTHSTPVHDFRQGLPYDGVVERAILGEAAFTVVMSTKRRKLEEMGILADMAEIVGKVAPATNRIAPYLMHILTGPALRMTLNAQYNQPGSSNFRSGTTVSIPESPFAEQYTPSNSTLDPEADSFLTRLSAHCVDNNESKDSFSNIDRIIQIGLREAGPVLTTTANEGLEHLAVHLPDDGSVGPGIPSKKPYIGGIPERAMLGEAALQALMKVPEDRLDERAFDIMAQSIANIGRVVLRSAHGLIEDAGFLVKAMVVVPLISVDGILDTNGIEEINGVEGTNGIVDDTLSSQDVYNRRAKEFSFVTLEQEVLDYYRGLETKPMQQIIEAQF